MRTRGVVAAVTTALLVLVFTASLPGFAAGKPTPAPKLYSPYWPEECPGFVGLEKIDTATGLGTHITCLNIEPLPEFPWAGFTPFGITFDEKGTMYTLVNWLDGDPLHARSRLARVDMATGDLTYIGDFWEINTAGPEMDACGNIYVTGFTVGDPATGGEPPILWGDSYLYRVDSRTGERVRVGDTGRTDWMDLAFDSQGRLWATTDNMLYRLDTKTGAATFVTDILGVPTSGIPNLCPEDQPYNEVMTIAFDDNNILWATAMKGFSACWPVNGTTLRVDPVTGIATLVGFTGQSYNHGGDTLLYKKQGCQGQE